MNDRLKRLLAGRISRRSLLALVAALTASAALITTALAVHDEGKFELDTPSANAVDNSESDTGPSAGDDWNRICAKHPTTCTLKPGFEADATTTASASSHVNDGSLNASIFTGGGSKDPEDITDWAWKSGAGGLPDKDNLLHAYAARYDDLIYFGSDRYDNSGDATQAFWFLQDKVSLGNTALGGGTTFNGVHEDGDVLVISEFSNGGTKSTITVYKWENGGLTFVDGGPNQKCGGGGNDDFCGVVNESTTPTDAPWPFLDKSNSSNFRQGELYEAGIDLGALNLGGSCFASFVAESRASTSTTATLKDFVLGEFETCQPSMATQVRNSAGTAVTNPVTPGTAVKDEATITITGASTPDDPTGTVTFFLCGPIADATPPASCPTGGTNIGTGALAGGTDTDDGIATATSPTVNDSTQTGTRGPLAPGRYCFRAEWPGDDNYDPASHTNATTECFRVKETTSITTDQKWLPQDTATIATGSGASAPAGTVTFSLYNNATCSGAAATTFTDSTPDATTGKYETNNSTYRTASTIISWSATFVPTNTTDFDGSTTTRCERSDLTINNSASPFPPTP